MDRKAPKDSLGLLAQKEKMEKMEKTENREKKAQPTCHCVTIQPSKVPHLQLLGPVKGKTSVSQKNQGLKSLELRARPKERQNIIL